MTAETYLRRSLLAPILVPVIAIAPFIRYFFSATPPVENPVNAVNGIGIWILAMSFAVGGIPYLWMLYAKRNEIKHSNAGRLEAMYRQLPLQMLPYF